MTGADFLSAGGDMGARMRAHDWSATPLGPVSSWPQSLKTTVSTCLNCAFPILIWWGPQLVMLYNDEYQPILGVEKHPRALGAPGREIWPEIWDVIGPMLNQVLQRGEATRSRDLLLVMNRNGYVEETYFSFSYSPIRDESGGVGGVFTPVIETTGTVVGERRLRTLTELAARPRADSVGEAFAAACVTLSANPHDVPFALIYEVADEGSSRGHRLRATAGVGPDASVASEDGSGWPVDEGATGKPVEIEGLEGRLQRLPTGPWPEPPRSALLLPIALPGRKRPSAVLVCGVNPRRMLDEEHRGFFDVLAGQIAQSLAEAQSYEDERRRAEAFAQIDAAKTTFFSNVSHEFRTPLTLISTPVEEILESAEPLSGAMRSKLLTVRRNGDRLLKLVNTLLDFSRIEAGHAQARYAPIDLGNLTTDLASNFRSATDRAGLDLIVDCPSLTKPAYVDPAMWERIVLNLLSNAFKFTFEGSIVVRLRQIDGEAVLTVRDTGTGVAADDLPRLFDRFHRVKDARGRSIEGSGIGLALVQELVALHGGRIDVESEVGAGSEFRVTLPLGSSHLAADSIAAEGRSQASAGAQRSFIQEALSWLPDAEGDGPAAERDAELSRADGGGRRILLADDNADMRDYLGRLLSDLGYRVHAVVDGEAALAAARTLRPDLILSDVMMPKLDGFQLIAAVRNDPEMQDTPIILLSARAGEEATIGGLHAGADDYVVKPFSPRELAARVKSAIGLAEARRETEAARRAETVRIMQLFDRAPGFIAALSGPGHVFEFVNESYRELVGRDELVGKTVAEALPEVVGQGFIELLDRAFRTGEPLSGSAVPVVLGSDAQRRKHYVDFIYQPIRAADGSVTGIFVEGMDVTARAVADERQQVLVNELNHRVKNTLATVQAIVAHSLRSAGELSEARTLTDERIMSFARAHDMLTQEHWEGASLSETVAQALSPFAAGDDTRIRRAGDDIRLTPSQALALSLALHELATNASKYGALSNETGHVEVSWRRARHNGGERVRIRWRESGGPTVKPPTRTGFGTRLLERGLGGDLEGNVTLQFRPEGLLCEIEAQLRPAAAEPIHAMTAG